MSCCIVSCQNIKLEPSRWNEMNWEIRVPMTLTHRRIGLEQALWHLPICTHEKKGGVTNLNMAADATVATCWGVNTACSTNSFKGYFTAWKRVCNGERYNPYRGCRIVQSEELIIKRLVSLDFSINVPSCGSNYLKSIQGKKVKLTFYRMKKVGSVAVEHGSVLSLCI